MNKQTIEYINIIKEIICEFFTIYKIILTKIITKKTLNNIIKNIFINLYTNFGLEYFIKKKNINVDNFNLAKNEITDLNLKNCISVEVTTCEIPNTNYAFSETYKNTYLKINGIKITIPDGNYKSYELINEINKQINLEVDSLLKDKIYFKLDTYEKTTIIENLSDDTQLIEFDNDDEEYKSLGYYLGFRDSCIILNQTSKNKKSELNLYVVGDNYFFLEVNNYGNFYNLNNKKKYITKILLKNGKNIISFNEFEKNIYYFKKPKTIQKLKFDLRDKYGNIIKIKNKDINYSFTLKFSYI